MIEIKIKREVEKITELSNTLIEFICARASEESINIILKDIKKASNKLQGSVNERANIEKELFYQKNKGSR